jgi:hypothetical protein
VLRGRVLQEPTVFPLPKVLWTFDSTCKFSNVRKGLSLDWTDPQVYESIADFYTVAFGSILLSFKYTPKFRLFNEASSSADLYSVIRHVFFLRQESVPKPCTRLPLIKILLRGPGSSVGIATDYGLGGRRGGGGGDFPPLSRPALGPTQPPVQWVPGLSRG